MNRRLFLKALCLSPVIPSVLMAKEKYLPEVAKTDDIDIVLDSPPDTNLLNDPTAVWARAAAEAMNTKTNEMILSMFDNLIVG